MRYIVISMRHKSGVMKMFKLIKDYKVKVFLSLVFATIGNLALVLTPFYLGKAIDAMVSKAVVFSEVLSNLKIALLLYIVNFIFVWISNYISFMISANSVSKIRDEITDKLMSLPLSYLDQKAHGKLGNLISNDSELILDGLFQMLSQILGGLVILVSATFFMSRIHVGMTFLVYLTVPFVYLSSHWVSKSSIKAFKKQQEIAGTLNGFVNERIHNHELVLNTNYQDVIIEQFENINDAYNEVGQKAQFISSLTNPTSRVVNNLSYGVLGLVGALSILKGELTVGFFTSFLSYSMMFSKPFNELSANLSQVFAAKASLDTIEHVLGEEIIQDRGVMAIESEGNVLFENVSFSYDKKRPLIQDINLNVTSKQKIAIVGPTGAGKSTLINILMRYYEVDQGDVFLDGVSLYDLSRKNLHKNISVVLQEPWLFEGTIEENIRYGKKDASMEEIIEACKKADCHEMIMRFDKGYQTKIHRGATNISKGQMQLLTIARALIMDASILILDEATSNIDALTEKRIQKVFTKIMKEHTSFFVAHRLSTVIDSDVILVMRDGAIIEKGNHQELLAQNGFYKTLFESQYS